MLRFSRLLILSLSLTGCMSLLYAPRIPMRKIYDPQQLNMNFENIEFDNADGTRVSAWWFPAKKQPAKGTFVFFHGNGENMTTHFLALSWLPDAGYNYFIFDYPGYGVSPGVPSPDNVLSAGIAAIQWVHDNKDPSPLIVYGQSLGGNIAHRSVLDLKDKISFRCLILDGTFLSYRGIAREKFSEHWFLWPLQPIAWLLMSDTYAPKEIDKRAPIPLLVVHGMKDKVVDPEFGDELFTKAPDPKLQWKIENGHHGDNFFGANEQNRQRLLDYLAGLN